LLKRKRLTLKIFLFLVGIDFLETFAQFCFKKAALSCGGNIGGALRFIQAVAASPFLWAGLASVAVIFAIWTAALSRIDLSVAVPVCSISYITIPLVAVLYFHEQISLLRWCGIFFIIAGILLVSASSKHKEAPC
jgi:drug/metabolite transporter (DMT)-like permease